MSVPGERPDRKGVAERLAALGFGCDVYGRTRADFVHEVDEIMMLIEGEIEVSFAGNPPSSRTRRS